MILVLKKESYCIIKVSLLRAISFMNGVIFFVCRSFEVQQSKHSCYVSTKYCTELEIHQLEDLADHQPLHKIGTPENFYIPLHHFISDGQAGVSDTFDVVHQCSDEFWKGDDAHVPLPPEKQVQLSQGGQAHH